VGGASYYLCFIAPHCLPYAPDDRYGSGLDSRAALHSPSKKCGIRIARSAPASLINGHLVDTAAQRRRDGISGPIRRSRQYPTIRLACSPFDCSLNSATLIAFEIGRVACPYDIEILYGPLLGRHLECWLRTRKLHLRTCVQTRDYLGRGRGASLHHDSEIYYGRALKHPHHTSLGHATSLPRRLFSCSTEQSPLPTRRLTLSTQSSPRRHDHAKRLKHSTSRLGGLGSWNGATVGELQTSAPGIYGAARCYKNCSSAPGCHAADFVRPRNP
jgi:hypothetical protein